jgi:hypothetical protein
MNNIFNENVDLKNVSPVIAKPLLCEVVFTKEMFIKAIHEIEKQCL